MYQISIRYWRDIDPVPKNKYVENLASYKSLKRAHFRETLEATLLHKDLKFEIVCFSGSAKFPWFVDNGKIFLETS